MPRLNFKSLERLIWENWLFTKGFFTYVAWGDLIIKTLLGKFCVEILMFTFDFFRSFLLMNSTHSHWRKSHVNSFPVRTGKLQIRKIPASTSFILFFFINCHKVLTRADSIPLCDKKQIFLEQNVPMSQQLSCTASCEKRFFFRQYFSVRITFMLFNFSTSCEKRKSEQALKGIKTWPFSITPVASKAGSEAILFNHRKKVFVFLKLLCSSLLSFKVWNIFSHVYRILRSEVNHQKLKGLFI